MLQDMVRSVDAGAALNAALKGALNAAPNVTPNVTPNPARNATPKVALTNAALNVANLAAQGADFHVLRFASAHSKHCADPSAGHGASHHTEPMQGTRQPNPPLPLVPAGLLAFCPGVIRQPLATATATLATVMMSLGCWQVAAAQSSGVAGEPSMSSSAASSATSTRSATATTTAGAATTSATTSSFPPPKGKLLLTGGVSSIDGAAGGGLTPWALTGSYATEGQIGATAYYTRLPTQDYGLSGYGALVAFGERAELSIARQDFSAGGTGAALGLPGLHLKQTLLGTKLRLGGDAVLDADTWMPQLALGLEYKWVDAEGLNPTLSALGAKRHGVDVYLSATKLFLAQSTLVNLTLRASRANQNGLLGFGGAASRRYSLLPEMSVAYLLNRHWAVGVEYRMKPDKLNPSVLGDALKEQDWKDVFVAWAPNKNISLTAAYVDLGQVVPGIQPRRQRGVYGSIQLAY